MRLFWSAVLIVSFAAPLAAQSAFRAANLLYVVPITADTFEVIESRGAGASDIWCAAADYVRAAGLSGTRQRMYILEPRGPSKTTANARGVVFTINPSDELRDTAKSYTVTVKRKGENLPVEHAYDFCVNMLDDIFLRF